MMTSTPAAPTGLLWKLARLTAPVTRALAGRRFFPLWAVVHHRGRVSGRELAVPVAVIATGSVTGNEFVIVLPWGPGTNWVRNVLAAGTCVVRWKGRDHRTDTPRVLDRLQARPYYSTLTWAVSQRVFTADSFLLLRIS